MSATLVARGLTAEHGDRVLFHGLDLVVAPGDVMGLVGANGAGKSTLLRILAGERAPDAGTVALTPATATVGYLPQTPVPTSGSPGGTVGDYLARRTGVGDAQQRMDRAAKALADGEPGADEAYAVALERWLALGGADLPERTEVVVAELGLAIPYDRPMAVLSGGQAARVAMAALLLSRYDVYLLDEPTNDLDLAGLARLEDFVTSLGAGGASAGRGCGTVLVSHDREFLARTVTSVLELDLAQQQVNHYGGGYLSYLEERAVARAHARASYEDYAGTRSRLEERARTQRAWADKGVRNARRKATDNDKSVRNFRAESSEKQASKVRATERLIERLDVVDEPRKEWELRMTIAAAPRAGAVVASLRDAVVRRGTFLLGPVTLQVDWSDRIGVVGANGSGKSTLLAALLGRIPLDAGNAGLGPGVVVGEVDQARAYFSGPEPLVDAFRAALAAGEAPGSAADDGSQPGQRRSELLPADVRTLLAKFGLGASHVLRPAAILSPGERTRAALALLQAKGVNLLVLDEPTNHLDLPAIEQLESALATYPGTLLLVTHDRRMLDSVRLTRMITLREGRCVETSVG